MSSPFKRWPPKTDPVFSRNYIQRSGGVEAYFSALTLLYGQLRKFGQSV